MRGVLRPPHAPAPRARRLVVPMTARDPGEAHRASTPLELLFDLCFVVAVAQASAHLHHGIAAGHTGAALAGYLTVFFAIWWAWMNFTWFASAYDTDDVPHRLAVLVQIVGVLVIAAGVPRAFDRLDHTVVAIGYATMRLGLVAGWLRAARADRRTRSTALRYALGVTVCQAGWLGTLALPADVRWIAYPILVPCELSVPVWAERRVTTPWHPHHIAERFGLLTLIVLGESVLAATLAIQSAVDTSAIDLGLVCVIAGAPLIIFSMWWLYFDHHAQHQLTSNRVAFVWGYGHYAVFASAAAVGAGLALAVDQAVAHGGTGAHPALSDATTGMALAVPVAIYTLAVWLVHRRGGRGGGMAAFPIAAAAVLAAGLIGARSAAIIGLVLAGLVAYSTAVSGSEKT